MTTETPEAEALAPDADTSVLSGVVATASVSGLDPLAELARASSLRDLQERLEDIDAQLQASYEARWSA